MNRTILFLCTGNSCRSILAEATFNHLAPAGWGAISAGSQPTGMVHPRSLALLAREGIATDGYCSRSWSDLPRTPDVVVTVCTSAAGETCPVYLGPALRTHWGVDDPAHATGTDAEIDAEFVRVPDAAGTHRGVPCIAAGRLCPGLFVVKVVNSSKGWSERSGARS